MQGTLQDFRIAEILQLVAGQQKTGLLRVESHGKVLTFYFDRGTLVSCRDRRNTIRDPLADYVLQYGIVDKQRGEQLAHECEQRKFDFAARLLGEHLIDPETLGQVLDDLAQELVYRTFDWRDGTYRFILGEEFLQGLQHRISHTVESLLMEAARRADEWPRLRLRIPGSQVLLELVESVPADIDPQSAAVLERLSTPRRVGDLVATSRIPEYEVYEILSSAVEAGIVRILEVPAARGRALDVRKRPAHVDEEPIGISSLAMWVLAVSISILSACGGLIVAAHARNRAASGATVEIRTDQARHDLATGLEAYRAITGRYPVQLDELTLQGLVQAPVIAAAGVRTYTFRAKNRFDIEYQPAAEP
jgi:hypothetical protein